MTDLTLPDTMADLLEMALGDLEACEADPQYRINMSTWLQKTPRGCQVCLAGAVIAQRVPPEAIETCLEGRVRLSSPWKLPYGEVVAAGLTALDEMRRYHFGVAFLGFYDVDIDDHRYGAAWQLEDRFAGSPSYAENPAAFKRAMRAAVTALREAGL